MRYHLASERDPQSVTITLLSEAGAPVGLVDLPDGAEPDAKSMAGGLGLEVNPSGAPAAEVLAYGEAKATQLGCGLVIIDPNGLRPVG